MTGFKSWGNYPQLEQQVVSLAHRFQTLPQADCLLPLGNGRSYGDSCQNENGILVSSRNLRHFIDFDSQTGLLRCEAGVLLAEIIDQLLPKGWFLPVTPGTRFVSVGGAIANDVHGKNHHLRGTFGNHVKRFELLRSDGSTMICSAEENQEMYAATIGGLGLTGFILWADVQLMPVQGNQLHTETIKYSNLNDFFELSEESEKDFEYTVAWVDCLASGAALGRGHFSRGNHANSSVEQSRSKLAMPFTPPVSLVNKLSLKAFNTLYYHRQQRKKLESLDHYAPFFYPLDGIQNWNRMYGPKGFLQYQFVVGMENARQAVAEVLKLIARSGTGSFLAVLKVFGDVKSPGLMSFPQQGATLALDFPFQGDKTFALFRQFDQLVAEAGGRIYPAKDAHTSADNFQRFYPQWQKLEKMRDPNISSSYWRRVSGVDNGDVS